MGVEAFPVKLAGRRQSWQYNVKYFGGDMQQFKLNCISLAFLKMSRADVFERVRHRVIQVSKLFLI